MPPLSHSFSSIIDVYSSSKLPEEIKRRKKKNYVLKAKKKSDEEKCKLAEALS